MERSLIRSNIFLALSQVFIFIDDNENEDVDLGTHIKDSIQFMSLIVKLEQVINIEFPPDLLLLDNFRSSPIQVKYLAI